MLSTESVVLNLSIYARADIVGGEDPVRPETADLS